MWRKHFESLLRFRNGGLDHTLKLDSKDDLKDEESLPMGSSA
jgi:hypothetical protein